MALLAGAGLPVKRQMALPRLGEVEEHDNRWITDWSVIACEDQLAAVAIHPEHRDVVAPLVTRIEELTGGVEIKAPWIVSTCPFLADEGQLPIIADREYPDAVMQTIAGIDEPPILGNHDLGAEVAAGETRRQAGDRLARC